MIADWANLLDDQESDDLEDLSVIHVFFANSYVTEYRQTLVYTWYELLSIFGAMCGIVIGASIISVMEMLWFLSGKCGMIWTKKNRVASNDPNWIFSVDRFTDDKFNKALKKNKEGIIYWEEFKNYTK